MTDPTPESPESKSLHRTAYELKEGETYTPFVRQEGVAEFTLKSVVAGITLGVVFGMANAYLGLMAGLTISTSIPVAVLTVVFFRCAGVFGSRHTILEANMSQTIGSASSSVASGVLFTIPALFMWSIYPSLLQLTLLAMSGGLIGILAMIPLRRYLIHREHGRLPYPEGVACAEVLVASQSGGRQASGVFWGLAIGGLFKLATEGLKLAGKTWEWGLGKFSFAVKVSPALVGVGYILGPRVASVMVGGAALSSFVIIPLIAWWGADKGAPIFPEKELLISQMDVGQLWNRYVRYIGAGAVAVAGLMTLVRSIPVMIESFRLGLEQLRSRQGDRLEAVPRTQRDLPFKLVLGGVGVVLLILILVPGILGRLDSIWVRAAAGVLIAIFAFFFVTVAARIVGMVGVTSNPTSGMTIATLLGTSILFFLLGWNDNDGKATALMVGTTVAIAASIAGDTSQDLKTGYLLGATPRRQQTGELLGVLTSAFFVCWTVVLLDKAFTIGSDKLPAPQATLMKLVVDGVIDQELPWLLIGIGAGLAVVAALLRLPTLAFAVGVYLPLSTMSAVFLGGMLRYALTKGRSEKEADRRRKQGVLFASGLVGGEGLMGVGLAAYVFITRSNPTGISKGWPAWVTSNASLLLVTAILLLIAWSALRKQADQQ